MAKEIVEAPITGTIISIDVKVGDKVEEGDILLYIESMKMENPIMAPVTGPFLGTPMTINNLFFDSRSTSGNRFVIQFNSVPGRTYTIEYSDDLVTWKIAVPSIVASANVTQWYDDGPPKTLSKPGSVPSRFYRVFLDP